MMKQTIRASSLPDFADCPARWAARHLQKKFSPTSPAAWLGTSLHAATMVYDKARFQSNPVDIEDAEGVLVDKLLHPEEGELKWEEIGGYRSVEFRARSALRTYCRSIAITHEFIAIEMTCKPVEIEMNDIVIRLTGQLDRIRKEDGRYGITDLKSGKTATGKDGRAKTKGHGFQLGVYEILGEATLQEPIQAPAEIVGMNTSNGSIGTGLINNARLSLIGTIEQPGLLQAIGGMVKSGLFYGNPKSQLCSQKYCPEFNNCFFRV